MSRHNNLIPVLIIKDLLPLENYQLSALIAFNKEELKKYTEEEKEEGIEVCKNNIMQLEKLIRLRSL